MTNHPTQPETFKVAPKRRKPRNPLSAYNIFFKIERKRILFGEEVAITRAFAREVVEESKANAGKKRPHRRSHGKVGFHDLTSLISAESKIEREEYARLLKEYKEEEEQFSFQAATKLAHKEIETRNIVSPSADGQSFMRQNFSVVQDSSIQQLLTKIATKPTNQYQAGGMDLSSIAGLLGGNPQQQQYSTQNTTSNSNSRDLLMLAIRAQAQENGLSEMEFLQSIQREVGRRDAPLPMMQQNAVDSRPPAFVVKPTLRLSPTSQAHWEEQEQIIFPHSARYW